MRNKYVLLLLLSFLLALNSSSAFACLVDPPQVTNEDLQNPPENMLAFKGKIVEIMENGPLDLIPHQGFIVNFLPVVIIQGKVAEGALAISYGPCHRLPGQVGSIIPVLARQDKNNMWYAPDFWSPQHNK